MKIPLFSICLIVLVLCESNDKTQYVATLTANIKELGDNIYNMATTIPLNQGDRFLSSIRQFNKYLKEMVELSYADKNSTKAALDALITSGRPKFLETPFTHQERLKILDNFNWTVDDLDRLYADRVTSYTYWTDLLLIKNDNFQTDELMDWVTIKGM